MLLSLNASITNGLEKTFRHKNYYWKLKKTFYVCSIDIKQGMLLKIFSLISLPLLSPLPPLPSLTSKFSIYTWFECKDCRKCVMEGGSL